MVQLSSANCNPKPNIPRTWVHTEVLLLLLQGVLLAPGAAQECEPCPSSPSQMTSGSAHQADSTQLLMGFQYQSSAHLAAEAAAMVSYHLMYCHMHDKADDPIGL